jgi:hypothetical protein
MVDGIYGNNSCLFEGTKDGYKYALWERRRARLEISDFCRCVVVGFAVLGPSVWRQSVVDDTMLPRRTKALT